MSNKISEVGREEYVPLSGRVILLSDTGVEQTGLTPGAVYEFAVRGGMALCRWDTTTAAATDGGFTFAVSPETIKRVKCPIGNTLLNIIEAETGSTATAVLTIVEVRPY